MKLLIFNGVYEMSEENTKTMQEVVRESKTKVVNDGTERNLLDEFAMAALTGLIAANSIKDSARRSYIIAQEMMEIRKEASKGKLK